MYKLVLTSGERRAIEWIGDRYATGDDFYELLCEAEWIGEEDWAGKGDLTCLIPEYLAFEIDRLFAEDEYTFPCFSDCLASKLMNWVGTIV